LRAFVFEGLHRLADVLRPFRAWGKIVLKMSFVHLLTLGFTDYLKFTRGFTASLMYCALSGLVGGFNRNYNIPKS
jgi:hypothetical protein